MQNETMQVEILSEDGYRFPPPMGDQPKGSILNVPYNEGEMMCEMGAAKDTSGKVKTKPVDVNKVVMLKPNSVKLGVAAQEV